MAIHLARRVRPSRVVVIAAAAAAVAGLAPALATASPAPTQRPQTAVARPTQPKTPAEVQRALGELAVKNTRLVEKYDEASVLVTKRVKAAAAAQRAADVAKADYASARSLFVQMVQADYENQSFGSTGALLASDSGSNYLDRLATMDMMSARTSQVVNAVASTRQQAAAAASKAQTLLAGARKQKQALAGQKKSVQAQINKYTALLAKLNSAQRAAYQRATNPSVPVSKMHITAAGTGAAREAVAFALSQVGKPYVFGAAGPSTYDCSGLTMVAWEHAGVSLPHSAAGQYSYGHHVSIDDLQPGDLLFWYHPIEHVTMYIGNGYMVQAPTSGEDVDVVPLAGYSAPFAGATRLT